MTSHRSTEEIERDIEATRARLRDTAAGLEANLRPERLLSGAVERLRHSGVSSDVREFAGNLGHTVRDHPVPVTLASLGIGWLMAADARSKGHGHGNGNGNGSGNGHELKERGRDLRTDVAHGASRAQDGWNRALSEQPLVLGVLGAAVGAAIAAWLPAGADEGSKSGSPTGGAPPRPAGASRTPAGSAGAFPSSSPATSSSGPSATGAGPGPGRGGELPRPSPGPPRP